MAVDLATIGTLVVLVKNVIDSIKAMGFFSVRPKSKISGKLAEMFTRVEEISAQIEQVGILIRMVPAWREFANHMPMWKQASDLSSADAQSLDRDLREFVRQTLHDTFAGAFVKTGFNKLPDIPPKLDIFRKHMHDLEQTVKTIAPQNFESLKAQWSQITVQFNQARNAAGDIELSSDNLQVKLVNELRDAAKEGRKVLAV